MNILRPMSVPPLFPPPGMDSFSNQSSMAHMPW